MKSVLYLETKNETAFFISFMLEDLVLCFIRSVLLYILKWQDFSEQNCQNCPYKFRVSFHYNFRMIILLKFN